MRSRISVYETNAAEIYEFLHFSDNVTEDETRFALSALCQIVARQQAEIEKLCTEKSCPNEVHK